MDYLAVLGRQKNISLAELESLFDKILVLSPKLATFKLTKYSPVNKAGEPDINRLGGVMKLAKEIKNPLEYIINDIKSSNYNGKIIIGVSDYSKKSSSKTSQRWALDLKAKLKKTEVIPDKKLSVRILANKNADLSTATVYHNHLCSKPGHFEIIHFNNRWFVGIGVQDINAYTARDQARPARDTKVGMLPPKLAQILINLCGPLPKNATVLDPFCGTGVVLQEAYLMGYRPYGTDLSERMVDYSLRNLTWIAKNHQQESTQNLSNISVGDATNYTWNQPIDAVACEGYLGPPMSLTPTDIKLKVAKQECKTIILGFLKNILPQITSGTPIVMAIPAWLRPDGHYQRLNILDEIESMGYNVIKYNNLSQRDLLYYRDGQVVAREIIVLRKK
ncbi:hypothetical protein IJG79_00970 [Candidatus Saccharibacteria bacterium]|nr:hypothetical protein [Candidatus Saccharibacteria bacterium]